MQLFTDVSGTDLEGWGAYWSGRWICDPWSPKQQEMSIAWKELYVIVIEKHTLGAFLETPKNNLQL